MEIRNLYFFDNNGYNLNFEWNEPDVASAILSDDENYPTDEQKDEALKKAGCYWEGSIYLPKVSVGLYANTSIYILEKMDSSQVPSYSNEYFPEVNNIDSNIYNNKYFFPKGTGKIKFTWDPLNKFVDEFFMFNFDESYVIQETSALTYTPNDGPECNPLIVNRFDVYEIPLDDTISSKALPIHIAFMADERYDATTYNRTLIMSFNGQTIAKIKFFAETVEEDERLKIWNANLGYNITPEDEMIFYKSDIKEYKPDYILLNEKRKELMMEGSNIYPYIGSYKAIINAIKFFGYSNLNIIEYWRNVNPDDENFGKIYHSSKYSLTSKETLRVGTKNIVLPNKDYKKVNSLALVYSINKPLEETDEMDLPLVKEYFTYTIEEALIKLFELRKKLNKEFMPGTSRIIDIIGEANYFGLYGITKIRDQYCITKFEKEYNGDFNVQPSKYTYITDNEYFNRYVNLVKNYESNYDITLRNRMLSDISSIRLIDIFLERSTLENQYGYYDENGYIYELIEKLNNNEKCEWFKRYHQDVFVDHILEKTIEGDDYPYEHQEYTYTKPFERFSAKVVLKNTTFEDVTFENCELKFNCVDNPLGLYDEDPSTFKINDEDVTFGNIDQLNKPDKISWIITMSDDQLDDDLKNVGVVKYYTKKDLTNLDITKENEDVYGDSDSDSDNPSNYNEFFVELPYVGYYDVTMKLDYSDNSNNSIIKTKRKCIKVEPYHINLLGFYYDARNLPKSLQYDMGEDMYNYIKKKIEDLTAWATAERNQYTEADFSMPIYGTDGSMINKGPYYGDNFSENWYVEDNLSFDVIHLNTVVENTRYIKNGVDVKPFTWFLLTYDYTKIAGKVNPKWNIINNDTGEELSSPYEGIYFTFLLKKEGNYTVKLILEDKNGNEYEVSRNIFVVSKSANHNIYQTFKKDYDYMVYEDELKSLNDKYFH